MKNRLSRIFRPDTRPHRHVGDRPRLFPGPDDRPRTRRCDDPSPRTVCGRLDVHAGHPCARRSRPPHRGGVVIRASGGPSILKELSNEHTAVDLDDAARMNVHAVAVQVFIGGEFETQSVQNLTTLVDAGYRVGIPVLGVTAVGKEHRPRRALPRPRHPHLRRARCPDRKDLLLRGLRARHSWLPGPDRHGRGEEAPRARGAHDGLQGHRRRCGRRGHGPQHLPVRPRPWP